MSAGAGGITIISVETYNKSDYLSDKEIEEIRKMWKYYNKEFCSSCMYGPLKDAGKWSHCDCVDYYDECDDDMLASAGTDIARLFEILDNNDYTSQNIDEIHKKWEGYNKLYCSSCLYYALKHAEKNGDLTDCYPSDLDESADDYDDKVDELISTGVIKPHLDDCDSDTLVYAGLHINILINEIRNKTK